MANPRIIVYSSADVSKIPMLDEDNVFTGTNEFDGTTNFDGAVDFDGAVSIDGALSGTSVKDEDNMASDSATAVPTQQSTKAYVDTHALDTSTHGVTAVAGLAESQSFTGTNKFGSETNYTQIDNAGEVTFVGDATVWDDIRVVPGSFDRPGASDPTIKAVTPGGSGTTSYLYEFAVGNIASFTVQLPHSYHTGQDIYVHVHWTPGDRGTEENTATVGWKIDYSWANINGAFGTMTTADLSDACNGVDWEHNMTPDVVIDGHTAAKGISSMLICNIKRTDTGTDDTWASSTTGQLPLLLEIDFHFPINSVGSKEKASK